MEIFTLHANEQNDKFCDFFLKKRKKEMFQKNYYKTDFGILKSWESVNGENRDRDKQEEERAGERKVRRKQSRRRDKKKRVLKPKDKNES